MMDEAKGHLESYAQEIGRHKKMVEEAQEAVARMERESAGSGRITDSTKQMLRRTLTTLKHEVDAESAELHQFEDELEREEADVKRLALAKEAHQHHRARHLDVLAPRLFESLDADGDGVLSQLELHTALSANLVSASGSAVSREVQAAEVRRANLNYSTHGGFVGTFGINSDFHLGLHKFNGGPSVSEDLALLAAMEKEFKDYGRYARAEGRGQVGGEQLRKLRSIETSNYGCIKTDLDIEWEFVARPDMRRAYPGQAGHTQLDPVTQKPFPGRVPIAVEQLMKHPLCKAAKLTRAETIGLRLYTGPAYTKLNGALRQRTYQKNLEDSRRREEEDKTPHPPEVSFSTTAAVINSGILKLVEHTPLAGTEACALKWTQVSVAPTGGRELTIPKLADALQLKASRSTELSFTQEEWRDFALGLLWEVGGETLPADGEEWSGPELPRLQKRLEEKTVGNSAELTAQEWVQFGLCGVHRRSYVKSWSCDGFLKPAQQGFQVSLNDYVLGRVKGITTFFKPARALHDHRTLYRGISRMCFPDALLDVGPGKPPQSFVECGFSSATPVKEVSEKGVGRGRGGRRKEKGTGRERGREGEREGGREAVVEKSYRGRR